MTAKKKRPGRPSLGAAKKQQLTVHLAPELLAWVTERAAEDDRTVSYYLTKLLEAERKRSARRKG